MTTFANESSAIDRRAAAVVNRGGHSAIADETVFRTNEPERRLPALAILLPHGHYDLRGWRDLLGAVQCSLQESRRLTETAVLGTARPWRAPAIRQYSGPWSSATTMHQGFPVAAPRSDILKPQTHPLTDRLAAVAASRMDKLVTGKTRL